MLRHDVLRLWLILAVHHVHVQLSFVPLEQGAKLGGVFYTPLQSLQEGAEGQRVTAVRQRHRRRNRPMAKKTAKLTVCKKLKTMVNQTNLPLKNVRMAGTEVARGRKHTMLRCILSKIVKVFESAARRRQAYPSHNKIRQQ